jgi:hypothetical protein
MLRHAPASDGSRPGPGEVPRTIEQKVHADPDRRWFDDRGREPSAGRAGRSSIRRRERGSRRARHGYSAGPTSRVLPGGWRPCGSVTCPASDSNPRVNALPHLRVEQRKRKRQDATAGSTCGNVLETPSSSASDHRPSSTPTRRPPTGRPPGPAIREVSDSCRQPRDRISANSWPQIARSVPVMTTSGALPISAESNHSLASSHPTRSVPRSNAALAGPASPGEVDTIYQRVMGRRMI